MTKLLDPTLLSLIEARNADLRATHPSQTAEDLIALCKNRAEVFDAHVSTMALSPVMVQWAMAMSAKYGTYVKVYHYVADWITALLVLRYGQAVTAEESSDPNFEGWPTTFSSQDMARANKLLMGHDWPDHLVLLNEGTVNG